MEPVCHFDLRLDFGSMPACMAGFIRSITKTVSAGAVVRGTRNPLSLRIVTCNFSTVIRVKNIVDTIFFTPDVFAAGRLQTSCNPSPFSPARKR